MGLAFIRRIAKMWKAPLRKKIFLSKAAEVGRKNEKILLAIPLTYMNSSGQAVKKILAGRRIRPENLVVVYDDLDIPLGEIRIRKKGGPGTHRGMLSIVQEIQTTGFPRIRVGIGPLPPEENATAFVLSPFEKREEALLERGFRKAQEALEIILNGEMEKAMNIYNQREKTFSQ